MPSEDNTGKGAVVHILDENSVTLPVTHDHFKDFISGILGVPQTIEFSIGGPFSIGRNDIGNIYHLVIQRVAAQNDAHLISFGIRIIYDDNSSILLNSYDEYISYAEIRPLVSNSVHLSWVFLANFPNAKVPERQQIDISFVGRNDGVRQYIGRSSGVINVRINHTDRSWGADIQAMISGHVRGFVVEESKVKLFLTKHSEWVGLIMGVILVLILLYSTYRTGIAISEKYVQMAKDIGSPSKIPVDVISKKLDLLISISGNGIWNGYVFYAIVIFAASVVAAIIITVVTSENLNLLRPSFVTLTPKSEKHKINSIKRIERNYVGYLFSLLVAILIGIVTNFLFYYISKTVL